MKKKCSVCSSTKEVCVNRKFGKLLCARHYHQVWQHGKVLTRTRLDKNKINLYSTHAGIELYNSEGKLIGEAKISLDKVSVVSSYKWCLNGYSPGHGYVINGKSRIFLHHIILSPPDGYVIDHKNGDKLDNRNENLRIVSPSQNGMNRKRVSLGAYSSRKRWRSVIVINKKKINLGSFKTKEEALAARAEAEIKYFGEFSPRVRESP